MSQARRARDGARARGLGALATAASLAALAGLAGCGQTPGSAPGDVPPDAGGAQGLAGFPPCEGLPTIAADASAYRDEPRYGNAMDLVDEVHRWAAGVDGFEELWLDRDRFGWVHVGVHGRDADLAALQDEVAERFPGEGVVVVAVPHTLGELEALADRVLAALADAGAEPAGGSALQVTQGVVALYGLTATPEAEAALRDFAGEPLCVDPVPTEAIVPDGEQPTAGDSWRLLGHEQGVGEAYRTGVATTDEQLARLWAESGLPGSAPDVDWRREIAVWFGAVYGSSCPIRLDDVLVTGDVLHARLVIPGAGPATACTEDANPHAFVVAVERSLLPEGPFVVQLGGADPPPGAPEERTVVDVDLSAPGSRAADAELHPDAQAGPGDDPLVADGDPGMPPNGARYVWHPRPGCDGIVIGPLDGSLWRLADGEAQWQEADGQEVRILPVDDDLFVVSSPAMDYAFVRAADDVCGS